jgi:hypothetical protein
MSMYGATATDSYANEAPPIIVAGSSGLDYPAEFDYAFPGYVVNGWQNTTADERPPDAELAPGEAYSFGSTFNLTTDPTVGSLPGMVNRLPYASGPVDSNLVENFAMTGEYISIRRKAEASSGPVGASDYSSYLAAALTQAALAPAPVDRINAELLMSV